MYSTEPSVDQTAAENVVVPESGEDSEDEWNYIKVPKENATESAEPTSLDSVQPQEPIVQIEHTEIPEAEFNERIKSETSSSVFESHAVAQALAETHEELLLQDDHQQVEEEHQDDALEPELLQLESEAAATIDEAASFLAASKSAQSTDIDEDMDSVLNPDAKEFVPVSPQRSPATSPFGNGGLRHLHLVDDCVLAQSPRKGSSPIKDIVIPAELDFDNEISNRPQEIVDEINTSLGIETTTTAPTTNAQNGSDRPGSSSSQYSYQEMNLKEAMHGDEKQEYAPDDAIVSPVTGIATTGDLSAGTDPLSDITNESAAANHVNDKFLRESDPMSMSFYNDGSSDTGNPFAVDMNAVQVLPVGDDDDEDEQKHSSLDTPYHFEGHEGQHFVIQDTEFGMNNRHESKPEEDQYTPFESDQPEADLQSSQPSSIIQVVQELATEATSLLNEPLTARHLQFDDDDLPRQNFSNNDVSSFKDFEENQSDITATPTDDVPVQRDTPFEELSEAEQNYSHIEGAPEPERIEVIEELIVKTVAKRAAEEPIAEVVVAPENVQLLVDNTLSKMVGGQVVSEEGEVKPEEALPVEILTQVDEAATGVVEEAKERLSLTGTAVSTDEVEKKPTTTTTTTSATSKKPESKTTSKTSTTTKKPSTAAATRSVTTTATTTKLTATRPTIGSSPTTRPRSVPAPKSAAPIKPSTASTLAAKKPVPNGDAKSSVSTLQPKKPTTAAPTKSLSATTSAAATKSVAAKPTPRAPISSRPAAPTGPKTSSSVTSAATKPMTATKTTLPTTRCDLHSNYETFNY